MSVLNLDQTNSNILSGIFNKFTVFKNSEEIYDPVGKEFYIQIDLQRLTLSCRKSSETNFKRIFGYKQVYKYSLKLSEEEKSYAQPDYAMGFKLFLENRVFLLFCKSNYDFKIWVRTFKTFFDKKFMTVMDMNKKTKNENLKYSSLFKNRNSLGKSKIFDLIL